MRRIVISPEAATDLEEIWIYSFGRWDEAQADQYYDELNEKISAIAWNPQLGKALDEVRQGYRSLHINRHVVFYRADDEVIDVIRVLHDRMMPENYL